MSYFFAATLGYLLGSPPFGFLAARYCGLDIRKLGSGNIGATNVFRNLGWKWGVGVLLLDAFKGWLACFLCERFLLTGEAAASTMILLAGFAAVMGHNYTPGLGFKGGKGIATSAGVLLFWTPRGFGAALLTFALRLFLFRMVSLGALLAASVLPVVVAMRHGAEALFWVCLMMCLVAWWKHVPNIKRILSGTEPRLGQGGKDLNSKEKKE